MYRAPANAKIPEAAGGTANLQDKIRENEKKKNLCTLRNESWSVQGEKKIYKQSLTFSGLIFAWSVAWDFLL